MATNYPEPFIAVSAELMVLTCYDLLFNRWKKKAVQQHRQGRSKFTLRTESVTLLPALPGTVDGNSGDKH
jgi:hypothetical protein